MSSPTVFHTSRVLPYTAEQIYQAFSRADLLARWWGPDGFSNEFAQFEFKEGGLWVFTMIGPDGSRYDNTNRFVTLLPNQTVMLQHVVAPLFTLTVRLHNDAAGTRVDWLQVLEDADFAAYRHVIEPANEQNLTRLAAVLADQAASPNTVG